MSPSSPKYQSYPHPHCVDSASHLPRRVFTEFHSSQEFRIDEECPSYRNKRWVSFKTNTS